MHGLQILDFGRLNSAHGDASVRFAGFMERDLPAFGTELHKTPLRDIVAGGMDVGAARPTGP